MRLAQKLLFLNFILSYLAETALACCALNLLIKTLGAAQLGRYFAYSAILSIGLVIISIYISKKISALNRFICLHIILAGLAATCLIIDSSIIQARIVFLATMGFNLMIYFNNWSIVSLFVTPFESKRLFPYISTFGQAGVFLGSLFAISAQLGVAKTHFFIVWLVIKLLMVALGVFLHAQRIVTFKYTSESSISKQEIGLLQLLHHYRLVPRLTLWIFIWSILFTSILTLAGATFDRSGINLTVLYGILSLIGAVGASLSASFIYQKLLKWLKLGAILLFSSITAAVCGGTYLLFDLFAMAVFIYLLFTLIDGSFTVLALSTEFSLYPSDRRDRIRLLGEILSNSAGVVCVGFIFALPKILVPWVIGALFILLVAVGVASRRGYVKEVLQFLKSKYPEEQDNAIALFDMLEQKEGYKRMLDILINDIQLSTRIGVLETFASLGTIKPAPTVIRLLKDSNIDPLRIAILRYVGNIEVKKLDPFIAYQLFETLEEICQSHVSNILRAMAVKLWVQHGPLDKTVTFIMRGLKDKDDRIVANSIEGLNYVDYPGIIPILLPFLEHKTPRVRANCIITLWKYPDVRGEVQAALNAMLCSGNIDDIMSGAWSVGEVKDTSQTNYLISLLARGDKELQRGVPIALLKLGHEEYYKKVVDIILGDNEKQAINVCYLSLRVSNQILNERIIASICAMGEAQRKVAIQRYSQCGGFCREQLNLLMGKRDLLIF